MRRILAVAALSLVTAPLLHADVSIIERREAHTKVDAGKPGRSHHPGGATGSQALIDAQGMKYFINTNITFSTSSSASGAASEASYTHAVAASTSAGGTTMSTLNDSYDGYNSMCLSLNHSVASTCETGNANFVIYNKNGPATTECPGPVSHVNRQVDFPPQTVGSIQMSRKVFVPDNDQFARWMNIFTNTGGSPQTVTMVTSNNLGSDSNTVIVNDSSGNTTPTVADTWVTTFQNFTGKTTSDPRLGHVLQETGAPVQLAGIFFQNGNDNPFWGYTFTLQPGETKIIVNFGVNQPTKAAANAKSAQLAGSNGAALPANALQCLSAAEQAEIANFNAVPTVPIATVPTLSWGSLAALVVLLGIAAVCFLRRRATA